MGTADRCIGICFTDNAYIVTATAYVYLYGQNSENKKVYGETKPETDDTGESETETLSQVSRSRGGQK